MKVEEKFPAQNRGGVVKAIGRTLARRGRMVVDLVKWAAAGVATAFLWLLLGDEA